MAAISSTVAERPVKPWIIGCLALAALGLGGCEKKPEGSVASPHHGRYLGVGIYRPEAPWERLVAAQPNKDTPQAARQADDQAIIVVIDSETGEVRACGDLTGYCIGMNPWRKDLARTQIAPVEVSAHAARNLLAPVETSDAAPEKK